MPGGYVRGQQSSIGLLFQARPRAVTLNESLHQTLRYRLQCARRSCGTWKFQILFFKTRHSFEEWSVFKHQINCTAGDFFLAHTDVLT